MTVCPLSVSQSERLDNDYENEKESKSLSFNGQYEPNPQLEVSMFDIVPIYQKSYETLNWVFLEHFKKSEDYQKLVLQLNENMIEYRFYS